MPYEMPTFLKPHKGKPEEESDGAAQRKKKMRGSIAAAAFVGLSQVPGEAQAQQDVESHEAEQPTINQLDTQVKKRSVDDVDYAGKSITYSAYIRGERVPLASSEDTLERLEREKRERRKASFLHPSEARFNDQLRSVRESLGLNEGIKAVREETQSVFRQFARELGASPHPIVEIGGGVAINSLIKPADKRVSGLISQAIVQGMSESDAQTLAIVNEAARAEGLTFTYTMGGTKDWKLTFGFSPGVQGKRLKEKWAPEVAVTWRYVLKGL